MERVEVELVTGSNEQDYKDFVDNCSCALVQHTLEWRNVITEVGVDIPFYLLARKSGEVVGALPAFLYKCELGNLMVSVSQAGCYGGVVVDRDSPLKEEIYATLLEQFVSEAMRHDCLLVTVCTPPLFGELSLYQKYFQPDFAVENFFQYLDLRTDFVADLDNKRTGKIRDNIGRNIRKSRKYGLVVSRDDTLDLNDWYVIHQKRMMEIGAYPLPRSLFEGITRYVVKEKRGFWAHVLDEGRIIGGAVFVGLNQVVDYFMGAVDSRYMKKQPNSLLLYEMLKHAQVQGYRYWNWQSASSRQSSVYHYKAGWGSREGLHYYLTKVVGDISELRRVPLSIIKEKYRWHYVMPYQELAHDFQHPTTR